MSETQIYRGRLDGKIVIYRRYHDTVWRECPKDPESLEDAIKIASFYQDVRGLDVYISAPD